jgi:hypothetical protein
MGATADSAYDMGWSHCICGHGDGLGDKHGQPVLDSCIKWCVRSNSSFRCILKNLGVSMRRSETRRTTRYAIGFVIGLMIFVVAPEGARWLHGGAMAQKTLDSIYSIPNNTAIGTAITGNTTFSATGSPGQTSPIIGGESNVTACPGQGQNVIGTYVGPGSSMTVHAESGGGTGPVTGFRSTMTVGGPGCR